RDFPRGQTLHGAFEVQAERQPQAVAVQQDGASLTYQQLNQRANQLAHHLLALGVQPDDRVAICCRRGPQMLVGLLGILKAGAGYVPIDPAYPVERIAYLLQDSAPVAVLAEASTRGLLGAVNSVDLHDPCLQQHPVSNPQLPNLTPAHLAYVIYTSGSTGQPKGVMVEHHSVENLVHWHCDAFDLNASGHTSSLAGFGFDAMAWEVWPALCVGATLHLPPAQVGNENIDELLIWWLAQPLDVSFLPTPVAEYAFSRQLQHPSLRTLLIGGDRLRQFSQAQRFAVINNYGPTEATVVATSGRMQVGQPLHIGRPVANACVYVLDAHLRPVPLGVVGELYVGGSGVARGYLNQPEMTAERFLQDPFNAGRMYRTGDLARWLPDGNLDYLGRNDDQVKVRGVRVELGEIESRLVALDGIGEAVVLVREGRLVAWFTEHRPLAIGTLRAQLQQQLPEVLVPVAYVKLDAMPLTANGKLDRKALPEPDQSALLSHVYEAPQGDVETTLAGIWAEVLQVAQVGRHDHFFELGGHSLLAVSLIERMRQVGLSADVRVLFSQPTLAALAAAVGSGREIVVPANGIAAGCTQITPSMLSLVQLDPAAIERIVASVPGGAANVQDIYPLAPLQEGILYHHISAEQGDPYLLQSRMAFDSLERLHSFMGALQQVVARHDILRTAVVWEGLDNPVQVVWREAQLVVQHVRLNPADGDIIAQLHGRFDARHYRLDITQAPLLRMVYAEDPANNRVAAILLFHHLALDHTAMEVVSQEMRAFLFDQADALPEPAPFRNYVAQARLGVSTAEHEQFFREMLADIDEPTLPFGVQDVQGDGRAIEEAELPLDAALAQRVREQSRQLGVSAASLMHLAWAQVLGLVAGRDDVVFGTVLMGRMQAGDGADRALGMFINTLPLRVDVAASAAVAVKATHTRLSALLGHEHASLALAQRCSGVANSTPLFSALLNYRHSTPGEMARDGQGIWEGVQLLGGEERSNYPLVLSVDDLGAGFGLSVLAVPQIGAQRLCGYMHNAVEQLVGALENSPRTALNQLPVLPPGERDTLLRALNATARDFPRGQTLHGAFEVQAERQPQAVAVQQDGASLTYQQLNQRANQLAHHLLALGVQPDDRVAICCRRGPQMLVGLLGILKAGAGYVPIDPAYPVERIAYLLQDSAPVAVLAEASTRGLLGAVNSVDLHDPCLQQHPVSNPQLPNLTPAHLAYVIYTSGSTGQPKGVMVEHHSVENLVHWHCDAFDLNASGHTSSLAGFGFDAMAWEVWPA
ncbi:non-ribosomal peptide synthetase, partial [Pseudomonas poae]|uniref:non-ribosomal peptide synthetase n=1 Tax=Pseudomonas poae TaxID=200451 RepID=UPI000ADF4D34